MNLTTLVKEYDRHLARIIRKATVSKGLTRARRLGIAYYGTAASAVQALFDRQAWTANPTPGFVMRTAAQLSPIRMGFSNFVNIKAPEPKEKQNLLY